MDSSTLITIITAFAALIGAASPIIVALIQNNKEKPQRLTGILIPGNVVLNGPKKQTQWYVVLFFAFLGGFIGYGAAKLISPAPPPETTPVTTTFPSASETQTLTLIPTGTDLFDENFEDGKAQKVAYISGNWQIVTDESGNKVYDMDNSTGSGFPGIYLGSPSWKDYEIKFRTRFLEGRKPWVIIYFRSDGTDSDGYVISIDLENTSLNYISHGSSWQGITNREYSLTKNVWYWVRIEAKGAEIKVSIDDVLVINTEDTRYNAGHVTIQTGQYTHAQFDDIQVLSLEK